MADSTPRTWRAASLGLLGGALAVGFGAAGGRGARRILGLAASVAAGYILPIALASRRPPIPPGAPPLDPAPPLPTFTVLVAARDEAAVVAQLIRDVAAQDHRDPGGSPCFELVVVDDRSRDRTTDVIRSTARETGLAEHVRIVRREGDHLPDGKGAALTAAPPDTCRGDVVVVLDADARIGPAFLSRLAAYVRAGAGAVTTRRRIVDAGSSLLAGAQADEQTLDGEIQRGRWALGGCSEFRGNGIVIRRDLLEAVGGWRAEALTEDLDLSSRLAAKLGVTVAWALDAEVWEEPVRTTSGLWRQRDRWAEGALRRAFEHGPSVLRSPALSRYARIDFATYVSQLAIPPAILGALLGAGVRRRPGTALGLLAAYLAVGGLLAFDALRWEVDRDGRAIALPARVGRALRVAVFNGLWLVSVPGAMWRLGTRRGPVGYTKMDHVGGGGGGWSP